MNYNNYNKIPFPFREGLTLTSTQAKDISACERSQSKQAKGDSSTSALLALLLMEFISQ